MSSNVIKVFGGDTLVIKAGATAVRESTQINSRWKFPCSVCKQNFKDAGNLERHRRIAKH